MSESESDLHHLLVEFANAVQSASRRQRTEYLQTFHDRIAALQHTPEPVAWPSREEVARAILTEVSGNDPDELIHHPAQKSWEAPTRARWMQFEEAADAILALFPIEGGGKDQGRLRPSASVPTEADDRPVTPGEAS